MKRFAVFVALAACALLASACIEEEPLPADMLPAETMAQVLADLHHLEQRIADTPLNPQESKASFDSALVPMLQKYELDTATFNRSFEAYLDHPKYMELVYEVVLDTLEARRERISTF